MYWIIFAILIVGYFIYRAVKDAEIKKEEAIDQVKKNLVKEFIDWENLASEAYNSIIDEASEANKKIINIMKKLPDSEAKSIFEKYLRVIRDLPEMKLKYVRLRERYRLASIENRIKAVQIWQHYLSQMSSIRLYLYGYSSFRKGDLDAQQLSTLKEDFVAHDETKKIFEEMLSKDL